MSARPSVAEGYTLEEIPSDTGDQFTASVAINSHGQVIGNLIKANGSQVPFIYTKGTLVSLSDAIRGGTVNGLNDAGQFAGYWNFGGPAHPGNHAFLLTGYPGGQFMDLGTLGDPLSFATAINNLGQVAGTSSPSGGQTHAFLYTGGPLKDLHTLTGYASSGAFGLNDFGEVVGVANNPGGIGQAFRWTEESQMQVLDDGFYAGSVARAISATGEIVGNVFVDATRIDRSHAALWSTDGGLSLQDLGTLGGDSSVALAVNDHGQAVGLSEISASNPRVTHAFLYSGGVMLDLNPYISPTLGWILTQAVAINGAGQIVCFGYHGGPGIVARGGRLTLALLTPR